MTVKLVLIGSGPSLSVSYKGLVAEALRQLLGEQSYKQDEVLPPGYYTGITGRVTTGIKTHVSNVYEVHIIYCTWLHIAKA